MSLYTRFVSGILFPLQESLKHHDTVRVRRELETTQWWSPQQLAELQLRRLRTLLTEAGTHVPYYRRRFAEIGFDPASVTSLADLQRLPLLGKAEIRAEPDAFRHAHAKPLARQTTGGSSGTPFAFLIGNERISHDVAAKWRATRWMGVDIGDPEVVLWGSPIELGAQDRVRLLRDRLMRSTLLSAFEMSEANLDRYLDTIRRVRPKMLFGYPYSLALLAGRAEARGLRMDNLGIRAAFVTSELLYPHQRERIERVFGCKLANGYGGRDAGFVAHECDQGGMHITAEDIIVETLDAEGRPTAPGVAGEITVTHLATRDYPFIRYRTGDIGTLDERRCPCGRGLPLLREVQGRTNDFLIATDGTPLPCGAFTYLVRETAGVESFQVVQESLALTRIKLVTDAAFKPEAGDALVRGFRRRLGDSVAIELEQVAEIPTQASGKFRYIMSKVSAPAPTPSA
jgi:phenylacetate-CoA ligase